MYTKDAIIIIFFNFVKLQTETLHQAHIIMVPLGYPSVSNSSAFPLNREEEERENKVKGQNS